MFILWPLLGCLKRWLATLPTPRRSSFSWTCSTAASPSMLGTPASSGSFESTTPTHDFAQWAVPLEEENFSNPIIDYNLYDGQGTAWQRSWTLQTSSRTSSTPLVTSSSCPRLYRCHHIFISCTDHHIFYLLYRYQSPHFSLNLTQFQFQMLVCKSDLIKAINESDTLFADLKFQQWLFCRSNIPAVRTLFLDLQQQPLQPACLL